MGCLKVNSGIRGLKFIYKCCRFMMAVIPFEMLKF